MIDDVINSVAEAFLDEGVDEQVLQELKQMWTGKMMASKAVEVAADAPEPAPPNIAKVRIAAAARHLPLTIECDCNSCSSFCFSLGRRRSVGKG